MDQEERDQEEAVSSESPADKRPSLWMQCLGCALVAAFIFLHAALFVAALFLAMDFLGWLRDGDLYGFPPIWLVFAEFQSILVYEATKKTKRGRFDVKAAWWAVLSVPFLCIVAIYLIVFMPWPKLPPQFDPTIESESQGPTDAPAEIGDDSDTKKSDKFEWWFVTLYKQLSLVVARGLYPGG